MIVSAALIESCCPKIDSTRAAKLVTLEGETPIGQGPNSATTSVNRGSIETINLAISLDFLLLIAAISR